MNHTLILYAVYLIIAAPLTIWIARTLHKNGRVFLLNCMNNDEELADSINRLLIVGFYLINIAFVLHNLKINQLINGADVVIELLSAKLGTIMLILGLMHFFNIWMFTRLGKRKNDQVLPPQPVCQTFENKNQKV